MKKIIRKILREFDDSTEDELTKLIKIEDKKEYIEKLLPVIIKFFEGSFKDNLFEIEVVNKKIHYASVGSSMDTYLLNFKFNQIPEENKFNIRRTIINKLDSIFNINIMEYGVPLDIEIYVKTWKKI
jgi:hypothetical protein